MRRALMWLNVYGRQAVRHKLQKGLQVPFLCSVNPSTNGADHQRKCEVLPENSSALLFGAPVQ